MFDKIGDMPLHPLVIHAAVVGIPLAVLLAVLFALPWTRRWARWPLVVTAVGALAATLVSKESGEAFQRARNIEPGNAVGDLIAVHSELADQLAIIMIIFAVVAVVSSIVVPTRHGPVVVLALLALLAVAAVAAVWVVRVGDLGSRAVWNPAGQG